MPNSLPKKEYVLIRERGRRTSYFYGPKLGDLITTHLKVGESFRYGFYMLQMRRSALCRRTSRSRWAQVDWL